MAQFDLPLDDLLTYRPQREEPADFDEFWRETLALSTGHGDAEFTPWQSALRSLVVEDVRFPGFVGQPVRGWFIRPRDEVRGTVVQFVGYNGGRGHPEQWTLLPSAGYALFVMDNRGQTGGGHAGDTADPVGSAPQRPGRLSSGIEDPSTSYYRRVFADAAAAVAAVRRHPAVVADQVVVSGASQGGGIAVAAAGLCADLAGAMVDVPFLSHFRRAVQITDVNPYAELVGYLQSRRGEEDDVFRVLSYFDGMNFAARATAPALYSVGLCDQICPPSTVFAQYNHYRGDKQIEVYPYDGHAGGQWNQVQRQLTFLAATFGVRS